MRLWFGATTKQLTAQRSRPSSDRIPASLRTWDRFRRGYLARGSTAHQPTGRPSRNASTPGSGPVWNDDFNNSLRSPGDVPAQSLPVRANHRHQHRRVRPWFRTIPQQPPRWQELSRSSKQDGRVPWTHNRPGPRCWSRGRRNRGATITRLHPPVRLLWC